MNQVISVEAEWALHGKTPGREGHRVLACSTAELSTQNFEEAIGRFQLGALDRLPQVSVSYLQAGPGPGGSSLALATHKNADQLNADRQRFDRHGRNMAFTSYFCIPYQPLAEGSVGYQAMYQALDPIALPREDGRPLPITIAIPEPGVPAVDGLALRAAALLLTGRPVCVLAGAEQTTVVERLAFIDAIMTLLPYGLHSRMSAATWTRPTNAGHRFRLFFSDVTRATHPPDHVLHWGRPEATPLAPDDEYFARDYLSWLTDKVREPSAKLAQLTDPIGFGREQILRVLDEIGVAGQDPRPNYSAIGQNLLHSASFRTGPNARRGRVERILRDCAEHLEAADQRLIKSDILGLRSIADARINDEQQARYREIIKQTGLLRHDQNPGKYAGRLYTQLLRLAFTRPFSYESYCQLEDCLAEPPPHPTLLQVIDGGGIADPRVAAIVYWHLREADPKKLSDWYALDAGPGPVKLIELIASPWSRPHHARVVCEVTLRYLAETGPNRRTIRAALRQHGFLAEALRTNAFGHDQYQVGALYRLLAAAYPKGLTRPAIMEILSGTAAPPTPQLLAAVLLHVSNPADWKLAREAYAYGSLTLLSVEHDTAVRLRERAPQIEVVIPQSDEPPVAEPSA